MSDDLEARVHQFSCLALPGQPMVMHMGTSYLVNDLWNEVQRLRGESSRSPGCSKAEVDDALICQALNMRREIYFGAVMERDEFDAVYLDGLSDTVRAIAKREGHEL